MKVRRAISRFSSSDDRPDLDMDNQEHGMSWVFGCRVSAAGNESLAGMVGVSDPKLIPTGVSP